MSNTTCSITSTYSSRATTLYCSMLLLQLLALPLLATGHLRHHHHHHHDHHHEHNHHDHKHNHRALNLQSDYNEETPPHADIFDSCSLPCKSDIIDRYGTDMLDRLIDDGFTFEICEEDDYLDTTSTNNTESYNNNSTQQRALNRVLGATNQISKLWNNNTSYRNSTSGLLQIPYAIKDTTWFTTETLNTIQLALEHIEVETGVLKFVPRIQETEYIYFNHETYYEKHCAANMGKQLNKRTNIYLGWCKSNQHLGNIIHELLHALGFWHEHSRPDRDDYIQINTNYIKPGFDNNFAKASMVNSLGSPYDYSSIMHYPSTAFSTDNSMDTIIPITPLQSWETMGQRVQLSESDVHQLRLLYQCTSGPREGGDGIITMDNLCSDDCPCWEYALGECSSDSECMDDLVCADYYHTTGVPQETYIDVLPTYTSQTGSFSCSDYCHTNCCDVSSNSIILCPETCGSAPPPRVLNEVPTNICVKSENVVYVPPEEEEEESTTSSSPSQSPSKSPSKVPSLSPSQMPSKAPVKVETSTVATTTSATDSADGVWFIDWDEGKCFKYCIGDLPCGGLENHEDLFTSVEECCNSPLINYIPYTQCASAAIQSRTSGGGGGETSAPPTEEPTFVPTYSPSSVPTSSPETTVVPEDALWYVDWGISKCVKDCVGKKPCGSRRKEPWDIGYQAVQTCCAAHMSWKKFKDCTNEPNDEEPITTSTLATTTSTTTPEASTTSTTITASTTTIAASTPDPTPKPTPKPTLMPQSTASDTRWYPDTTKCINDGKAPSWQHNKYNSQESCCSSHFSWDKDNCMGIVPTGSDKYYIDWGRGKCVKDCATGGGDASCGGVRTESWISKHADENACCFAHMSYDINGCLGR